MTQHNLRCLGLLFLAVVFIAMVLVGLARGGSSPWFIAPPTLLGYAAILSMRGRS